MTQQADRPEPLAFPEGFVWGAASSSYQNEGAVNEDGKGPSIWDEFAARPGQIPDGTTGEVAADSYHRYPEDVALMADAGLGAYRFSVSWPRVLPEGTGRVEKRGLDYYDRLVDALLERGIKPFVNLYHWDFPLALQERGGWENRDVVGWMAEYARVVAEKLGDRAEHWMAINEPNVHAIAGFLAGGHAPGKEDIVAFMAALHHQNLAQSAAFDAIRSVRPELKVGTITSYQHHLPASNSEEDLAAAREANDFTRTTLDPLLRGEYQPEISAGLEELRLLQPGDTEAIRRDVDFIGLSYYGDDYVTAAPDGPQEVSVPREAPAPPGVETTGYGKPISPEGLRKVLLELRARYGDVPVYISETGVAEDIEDESEVRIEDGYRVDFLRRHIAEVHAAIGEGCDIRGFFAWTLVDNFEWEYGFARRYGLVKLERATGRRIPKDSWRWYAGVASANGLRLG